MIFLAQTTIDDYAEIYSNYLRGKVKEIIAKRDKEFVEIYFDQYDKSEVVIENEY